MISYTVSVDWDGDGTYTDETAYVESLSVRRGREYGWDASGRANVRYGEVTLGLNNAARRFDPNYSAGDLYGYLLPAVPIRITASESGVTEPVFAGFILDIRPSGFRGLKATMRAVDGLYWLGQTKVSSFSTQTTYPVVSALYDLALMSGWPVISASTFPFTFPLTLSVLGLEDNGDTIASWNYASVTGQTILQTMQDIAQAFGGVVCIDATGNIRYRVRYPTAPETFVITDSDLIGLELSTPWDVIYNKITVTGNQGGATAQVASNSTSIASYGTRDMEISSNPIIQTDAHAGLLADHTLLVTATKRFEINHDNAGRFAYQFGRDLMEAVWVNSASRDVNSVFFVNGIKHEARPGGNTQTTIYLEESFYEYSGIQTFTFTFPLTVGW